MPPFFFGYIIVTHALVKIHPNILLQ